MARDFIPECVPEYFRAMFAKEEHENELYLERMEHFNANKEKLDRAKKEGYPILMYGGYDDSCYKCNNKDIDTATAEDDDIGLIICGNPTCPKHREYKEMRNDFS